MSLKKQKKSATIEKEDSEKNYSPQIMIIDDSPDILQVLTDILAYHGYRINPFSSGKAALQSLVFEMPDLILLDIEMPSMNGYEICSRLKSDEKTSKIPVIFISGRDDATDKVKGFNAGGIDYITKPFQLAEVIARIETHISLCRLQKQSEEQNIHLQKEIIERKKVEKELLTHKTHLEELVVQRTAELKKSNEELQLEINERKNLENALEDANFKLHALVYEYGLRHQRMSLFNQMLKQLQACMLVEEAYPVIKHFTQKLFRATTGAIYVFDGRDNIFKAAIAWGKALSREKAFPPEDCLSFLEEKIHVSISSSPESCCRHLSHVEEKSSLCIPLTDQGKTFGILHLHQRHSSKFDRIKSLFEESSEGIDLDTMQLAVAMADFIALALVNIQLRETLKQEATRDALTGLFNRRYMEETMNREISRANRYGNPLGIIMLDLDHFKRFNNTFGHDAGDLVLQEMGKYLQNSIRKEDIACRYGGEEFTLIMPGASLEVTKKRAEMLQQEIQKLQINHNGKILNNITLSQGVAVYPDHGQTGEAVLKAADHALYRAKRAGRKQVKLAKIAKVKPLPN
ncbi:MAG: diguanylate cyclase [Syntrophaceae bacterium]|nr:diguanylate cyclase [Syntrophaceae bacterium]